VDTEAVPISKFKATCLELLRKVQRTGQSILVTRRGEPIAQIVPPPPPGHAGSWLGSMKGTGKILGDIVSPITSEHEWEALRVGPANAEALRP
jgi:prevent-host-death family protein